MKLTKQQLKQIIKEELQEMMGMDNSLSKLLDSEDEYMIMQGIELALALNMPIVVNNPSRMILDYVKNSTDSDLLTLMAQPTTHKRILFRIAQNQNTPIEVIRDIATNHAYNIRAANIATKSLNLYCAKYPGDKICADLDGDLEYRN